MFGEHERAELSTRISFIVINTSVQKCLKESVETASFNFLMKKKVKQSKGSEIYYHKLEMQQYMKPKSKLSVRIMQQIFQARTRNLNLKKNFPNKFSDIKCVVPECDDDDSQKDLFDCRFLEPKQQVMTNGARVEYDDLFSDCVEKQVLVVQILNKKYQSRVKYLASQGGPEDQDSLSWIRSSRY